MGARIGSTVHDAGHLDRMSAVLIDVDGTLIDSNAAHAETWAQALTEHGVPCTAARVRPLVGMGSDKLLPIIAAIDHTAEKGRAILERKKALFMQRIPLLSPTPGARALLSRLRRANKEVVVATSADDDEMKALLERAGVADLVSKRTSADAAPRSKPDPDIVLAARALAGSPAERTLMIGDTPYDLEAARGAGIGAIALRCGGYWSDADLTGAILVLDDPSALLAYWSRPVAAA
jgi:HAD superfamily hydrolase (TIGR01509 family)